MGGTIDYNENTIRISSIAGKLSHVIRHELSHANVFSILGAKFNPNNAVGHPQSDSTN
jgi:hypothetical protein